jgi:hypothetical protein
MSDRKSSKKPATQSVATHVDLPGFYYDATLNKYFAIPPRGASGFSTHVTKAASTNTRRHHNKNHQQQQQQQSSKTQTISDISGKKHGPKLKIRNNNTIIARILAQRARGHSSSNINALNTRLQSQLIARGRCVSVEAVDAVDHACFDGHRYLVTIHAPLIIIYDLHAAATSSSNGTSTTRNGSRSAGGNNNDYVVLRTSTLFQYECFGLRAESVVSLRCITTGMMSISVLVVVRTSSRPIIHVLDAQMLPGRQGGERCSFCICNTIIIVIIISMIKLFQ